MTRNIIETLSKYILNTWEVHNHFCGTFLKPTLQIFKGILNLVILAKKCLFLLEFFLTLPIFWPETDKLPKYSAETSEVSQIPPKNFFEPFRQKMSEKIEKRNPPPYTSSSEGGGCFWNGLFMTFFTWHVYYFFWKLFYTLVCLFGNKFPFMF